MIRLARIVVPGVSAILLGAAATGFAQDARATKLIDAPTAEVLGRGVYDLNLELIPDGGVLAGVEIGLLPRFSLGFNYGGVQIVGTGSPDWNPRAEFNARYQIITETYSLPALAIGFDSQGIGAWDEELERYQVKSKGFYAVLSRNWALLGRTALHGGMNYSVEGTDGSRRHNPSFFAGTEKSLGPAVTLMAEYDATLNDGTDHKKNGRLNFAAQWTYAEHLRLQLDARNILRSEEVHYVGDEAVNANDWSRGLQISYRDRF